MADAFDVVVVGGGPVGRLRRGAACRAAPRRAAHWRSRCSSRQRPLPADGALDARVVGVLARQRADPDAAGAWQRSLRRACSAYERMRVWHEGVAPHGRAALVFDAAEVGEPNLGYIIETRLVQAALLRGLRGRRRAASSSGELSALQASARSDVHVQSSAGQLAARTWSSAPTARARRVRAAFGIGVQTAQTTSRCAIVATVAHRAAASSTPPGSASCARRHARACCRWPMAASPSSGRCAMRRRPASCSPERARGVRARSCARTAMRRLGATRLVSERLAFPLQRLTRQRYIARALRTGRRCGARGPSAGRAGRESRACWMRRRLRAAVPRRRAATGEDLGALRTLRPTSAGARARIS